MYDNISSHMQGKTPVINLEDKSGPLPKTYGDTKVVIIPRDPMWFYAYWEVSPEKINDLRQRLSEQKFNACYWVLRVYDVTGVAFDGSNAHRSFDVSVTTGALNWYVNVNETNRSWCVDLGLFTPEGEFIIVTRSNILNMPRQGVSPITDEQWGTLQLEFERLLKMSGVDHVGQSSMSLAKLMRERWEEIISVSMSSPRSVSSFRNMPAEEKPKDFWMRADTELIIYGATEPDATLSVEGKNIPLYPDGSFSLRFHLPDQDKEYPIKAVSADGTMERGITFVVKRSTK